MHLFKLAQRKLLANRPVGKLAAVEEEQEREACMATVAAAGSLVVGRPVVMRGSVPKGRGWPRFNSCLCSC